MKISRAWLQKYFDTELPSAYDMAEAFTFHAFEIDSVQGDTLLNGTVFTKGDELDVKVLPNRAADCLSHRGLAKELSAILDIPLANDPLRTPVEIGGAPTPHLRVYIEDPRKCRRYIGALVRGVKVGPSPAWLKEALEAIGQRSINNVVDATNYVMLNIGQPLHAFDAGKLASKEGAYAIGVRSARDGEKLTTLSGEAYELSSNITLITDAHADVGIALAGIKGGKHAEVTADTTDLIIESANFDGTTTRRAAQSLKLFTDASLRFQNRPSPELAAYGMRDVLKLIVEIAGGTVEGITDAYPSEAAAHKPVTVSLERINGLLGSTFTKSDVQGVCERLGFGVDVSNDTFAVTPPFERTDITIPEDIVEEVGRIIGYDQVPAVELPPVAGVPDQARYRGIERLKDELVMHGFTEVSTQSFAKKGEVILTNPLDKTHPALRMNLEKGIKLSEMNAKQYASRVLGPSGKPDIFEIGTAFTTDGEKMYLALSKSIPELNNLLNNATSRAGITHYELSDDVLSRLGKDYIPARYELGAFTPFSVYPFMTRDIALWVPSGTDAAAIEQAIREHAGELLVRLEQFDQFEKEGRISYAFRLVFESMERTLTDEEVNAVMEQIYAALRAVGYEVR